MKVKIEKVFKDKYTGKLYSIGDVIDVTEARGKELLADKRGLVSAIEDKPVAKKKTTKKN